VPIYIVSSQKLMSTETSAEARKRWQWEGVQVFRLFIQFTSVWWTDRLIADHVKHRSF